MKTVNFQEEKLDIKAPLGFITLIYSMLKTRREVFGLYLEGDFSVFDFAASISEAIDLVYPALSNHHKKVAYISYSIAKEMDMPDPEVMDIVLAAILHDIGAFSIAERMCVVNAMFDDSAHNQHALIGSRLLQDCKPLDHAANIIKYHHAHYTAAARGIPIGSYIVHLADRLSLLLNEGSEVLEQVPQIMARIEENKKAFHPGALDALRRLVRMEYFWIEACSVSMNYVLPDRLLKIKEVMDLDVLKSFASVFSRIIDFRSRFTATHSSGVAAVALELATISGFSARECRMMEIAGYLHDLGKLTIPTEILEKDSALTCEEFNEMRKHSYYTYIILNKIKGFEQISTWAAYHHERLNGDGYPFHVKGDDFSRLARIVAVADIVTAITEDRPYRLGMDSMNAISILRGLVEESAIDKSIVDLVEENFSSINSVRKAAQEDALNQYSALSGIYDALSA